MGIIAKQTIKGTVWSFLGAFIGFINVGILMPRLLSTQEYGLINYVVSIATIFSTIFSFGFSGLVNRMFPSFRNDKNNHNGFSALMFIQMLFGLLFSIVVLFVAKDFLVSKTENPDVLNKYFLLTIPSLLGFFSFLFFDNYSKVLYKVSRGIFYKEFVLRFINLCLLLLFGMGLISLNVFLWSYMFSINMPSVFLMVSFLREGSFTFSINRGILTKPFLKEIVVVSVFGFFTSVSGVFYNYIDKLMIGKYVGLDEAGIYGLAAFFVTIILLPTRALTKIATPVIADAWKNNDIVEIKEVVKKGTSNLLFFGCLFYGVLVANLEGIYLFNPDYSRGGVIIVLLGVANLFVILGILVSITIQTSGYYRKMLGLYVVYLLILVVSNYIFIQYYQMVGVAIASVLSQLIFLLMRVFTCKKYFKFHHLTWSLLKVILILIIAVLGVGLIPAMDHILLSFFVRSVVFLFLFLLPSFYLKLLPVEIIQGLLKINRK